MLAFCTLTLVAYLLIVGYNYLDAIWHGAYTNNPKTVIGFGVVWSLTTAGVIACFIWLINN